MKIISLVLFALLLGCHRAAPPENAVRENEVTASAHPTPTEAAAPSLNLPLAAEAIALPDPHHYEIQLSWQGASAQATGWVLTRENKDLTTTILAKASEAQRTWLDSHVAEGEPYRYYLWRHQEGESTLHSMVAIQVPRDRVVDGEEELETIEGVNRLYLTPRARLRPRNFLSINVKELFAEGATIESFPRNARAATGPGRPGPFLSIKAEKAQGSLNLALRGESGANGDDGKPGSNGQNGSPGGNADTTRALRAPCAISSTLACGKLCHLFPNPNHLNVQELDRFYELAKASFSADRREWQTLWKCESSAQSGLPGVRGSRGENGKAGQNGGDTSALMLEISDVKGFVVTLETSPGNPGVGGRGGPGGLGGKGGAAGLKEPLGICADEGAIAGSDAANGDEGDTGPTGKPGNISPYCLRLGENLVGKCPLTPAALTSGSRAL